MKRKNNKNPWQIATFALFLILIITQLYSVRSRLIIRLPFWERFSPVTSSPVPLAQTVDFAKISGQIQPADGVELPIRWGNLGQKLIASGVIDLAKFEKLFEQQNLSDEDRKLINGSDNGNLKITSHNSQLILDLLWAIGLGNKNHILEEGPINQDPANTKNFASTGGWQGLSVGDPMTHFSRHQFITLTSEQQRLVEEVAKGVFRPCCGQDTYFPDCNHGMAMLGALELGAAQGLTRDELFKLALVLNQYWFSQTYLELATFFAEKGISWADVKPEEVLSAKYSSGQGYASIRQQIKSLPSVQKGGGGCGA